VTVGEPVTPGQIVAKLNPKIIQNALSSAGADLAFRAGRVGECKKYRGAERAFEQGVYDACSIRSGRAANLRPRNAQLESAQASLQNAKKRQSHVR